jgi:ribosome-associated protein
MTTETDIEPQDPRELALVAAHHALSKKATDVVMLDMRPLSAFTDYMVICTGQTSRQTKAIAEEVRRQLRDAGVRPRRIEGDREGEWILLDFLDIVVHVFTTEARQFYRLDLLWRRAPSERVEDTPFLASSAESPILEAAAGD